MTARHAATPEPEPSPDEQLTAAAQDREQPLSLLSGAEPRDARPWRVVRQSSDQDDAEVSAHRWEWWADLCAYRLTARHTTGTGVFYTVRRATR